ncbi:hypothetical protein LFM56_11910 [Cellulomonas iranensis]|nr:hypothetical protein [Cellulomonas iranensis]UCN13610.1 hypothetical protein LFM56_11910 [Cellulomonas iranensis]
MSSLDDTLDQPHFPAVKESNRDDKHERLLTMACDTKMKPRAHVRGLS